MTGQFLQLLFLSTSVGFNAEVCVEKVRVRKG